MTVACDHYSQDTIKPGGLPVSFVTAQRLFGSYLSGCGWRGIHWIYVLCSESSLICWIRPIGNVCAVGEMVTCLVVDFLAHAQAALCSGVGWGGACWLELVQPERFGALQQGEEAGLGDVHRVGGRYVVL